MSSNNKSLFFVGEPDSLTGFISIANEGGAADFNLDSLSKKMPGILVAFLSQSLPSFRNWISLWSADIFVNDDEAVCLIIYV